MISAARCFNHADRMAAARCLTCQRSYCRECVTEHDGRLTCAACLRKRGPERAQVAAWRKHAAIPAMACTALVGSWLVFYAAGWWLEDITSPAPSAKAAGVKGAAK